MNSADESEHGEQWARLFQMIGEHRVLRQRIDLALREARTLVEWSQDQRAERQLGLWVRMYDAEQLRMPGVAGGS
jgi:hypothetical protein